MSLRYCNYFGRDFGHWPQCQRLVSSTTTISTPRCEHLNGWYVTVKFWIFSKRIYVCSDCGEQRSV